MWQQAEHWLKAPRVPGPTLKYANQLHFLVGSLHSHIYIYIMKRYHSAFCFGMLHHVIGPYCMGYSTSPHCTGENKRWNIILLAKLKMLFPAIHTGGSESRSHPSNHLLMQGLLAKETRCCNDESHL